MTPILIPSLGNSLTYDDPNRPQRVVRCTLWLDFKHLRCVLLGACKLEEAMAR